MAQAGCCAGNLCESFWSPPTRWEGGAPRGLLGLCGRRRGPLLHSVTWGTDSNPQPTFLSAGLGPVLLRGQLSPLLPETQCHSKKCLASFSITQSPEALACRSVEQSAFRSSLPGRAQCTQQAVGPRVTHLSEDKPGCSASGPEDPSLVML